MIGLSMKNIKKMSLSELLDFIIEEYHKSLRIDLNELKELIESLKWENTLLLKELFLQFSWEILSHITQEEDEYFPEILKIVNNKDVSKKEIRSFLNIQEVEHNEIDSYLIGIRSILTTLSAESPKKYKPICKQVEKIYYDTMDHVYIENNYLNKKVRELLTKKK